MYYLVHNSSFCEIRREVDHQRIVGFQCQEGSFPYNFLSLDGKDYFFASPYPKVEVFVDCQSGEIWESETCGDREILEYQCLEFQKILLQRVMNTKRRREYWEFYDFNPNDGFMKLKESHPIPISGQGSFQVKLGHDIATSSKKFPHLDRDKEYIVFQANTRSRVILERQGDIIVHLDF